MLHDHTSDIRLTEIKHLGGREIGREDHRTRLDGLCRFGTTQLADQSVSQGFKSYHPVFDPALSHLCKQLDILVEGCIDGVLRGPRLLYNHRLHPVPQLRILQNLTLSTQYLDDLFAALRLLQPL